MRFVALDAEPTINLNVGCPSESPFWGRFLPQNFRKRSFGPDPSGPRAPLATLIARPPGGYSPAPGGYSPESGPVLPWLRWVSIRSLIGPIYAGFGGPRQTRRSRWL